MANPTSLPKYMAIIIYDFIIVLGILLLSISLLFLVLMANGIPYPEPSSLFFRIYIFTIIFGYYHSCWAYVANGQTIGMKAWHVKLVNYSKPMPTSKITPIQTLLRITGGILSICSFGIGYIILYFNKQHKTLADYLSNTQLCNIKSIPKAELNKNRDPAKHSR